MRIAVIGNYLPRRCGIATFTADLCDAIAGETGDDAADLAVVAMDDRVEGYDYPPRVRFQVRSSVPGDYLRAAEFLNGHRFDVAILQHEYGIFGGAQGAHILQLIRNLRMPVITTMHTVLHTPTGEQRGIVKNLAEHSQFLVVMARRACSLLRDVYEIDETKAVYIPHGIHDVPFERSDAFRLKIGLAERKILLTFGLLSPGKGIEVMIEAMAAVVERHPDAIYLVLGETHPHIRKASGDGYRQGLHQAVRRLGLEDHVRFHNRFVDLDVLLQYIQAADIYVTPYLNLDQIVSGTLAYALGAGTAIVSTPYWHAQELLAEGRGVLVPPSDPPALAQEINRLLDHEDTLQELRTKGYQHGRSMVWGEVARGYLGLAEEALERTAVAPIPQVVEGDKVRIISELPEVNLGHLRVMTDGTGMLQHAKYSVPDRTHGYCVDDNARALVVAGTYHSLFQDKDVIPLVQTYLSFLHYSFNPENGRFRNFRPPEVWDFALTPIHRRAAGSCPGTPSRWR
jgi:glycosyltransferase involved in cell wall biosynthesis